MDNQMGALESNARGYLEAEGYEVLETSEGFLVADAFDHHGTRDTRLVWVVPTLHVNDVDRPQLERRLLREFAAKIQQHPDASRWLVTHVRGEWSNKFKSELTEFGIRQRAEIEYFDTPFRHEVKEGRKAASVISSLRDPAIHQQRIPQPYSVRVDGEPQHKGDDLLDDLLNLDELRSPERSCLRIVVGPAGSGKTFLFKAFFSRLYEYFIDQKNRQEVFPRPIPLIPYYLREATELRTQELIDRFIKEDMAAPISRNTFEWMARHGYAMWLLDGLDELYAEDETFFDDLAKLLTESRAQILICVRDSLLASCETFVEFLEDNPPAGNAIDVRLYRLEDWERSSKRAFAWLRIEGYIPEKRQADPSMVSRFLTYVERSDPLRALSSLPYYCELLLEEFKRVKGKNPGEFSDDLALIEHAVTEIIKREAAGKEKKRLLKIEHFQADGFNEWLETVAAEFYTTNFKGIDVADVKTYAAAVLHAELSEEEYNDTVATLVQFPLFAPGPKRGVIAFQHELIGEYLAGRYWSRRIIDDPERVARQLGARTDLADSLIARSIARHLQEQPKAIQGLIDALKWKPVSEGRAFTNLLQLLLLATPTRDVLTSNGITLEGRDLSHVRFIHMDLEGFSFRGCNLSDTVFVNCNLQSAQFQGAYLIGTRFEQLSKEASRGANFGNLERFETIYAGKEEIKDRSRAIEWAQSVTGRVGPIGQQPCPAALQLRQLFRKFLRPDGTPIRHNLPEPALVRGKTHPGAPLPGDCVDACLKFGYLQGPDFRHYIKRTPGDRYSEMVHFTRDWQLSANMRQMLDSLCTEIGCQHVPASL